MKSKNYGMAQWGRMALSVVALGMATVLASPAKADVVVSAGADKKVKIWNVADGKMLKEIAAHEGAVTALVASADGKLLATGGADKKVKIWNVADGKLVKEIDAHTAAVTTLAFSPDGKLVLSGSEDKKVKIWNVADGKLQNTIEAHDGKVVGSLIIPMGDDALIITAGAEGMVKIWDKTGASQFQLGSEHQGGLTVLGGNVKEMCVYTGGADGKLKYFSQAGSGEFEGEHKGAINAILTTTDQLRVLTAGADGKLKIWSAEQHKLEATVDTELKGGVRSLAQAPDGKHIFTGGDKQVKVWDDKGKLLHTADAHETAVTILLYIADKKAEEKLEKKSR